MLSARVIGPEKIVSSSPVRRPPVTLRSPAVKTRARSDTSAHDGAKQEAGRIDMITHEEQNEQHTDIRGEKPFGQWLGLINGDR